MAIVYRDDLGYVMESVDGTIDFSDGYVYFNDRKVKVEDVVRIGMED